MKHLTVAFLLIGLSSLPARAAPTPLELLRDWVSISSGSADAEGVNRVQEKVAAELKSLGFATQLIANPDPQLKTGRLLLAELGGVAALRELLGAKARPKHGLRLVVVPSEEIGSNGFHDLLSAYSKQSAFTVGLEPARENGNIVTSRKGARGLLITVTGREAHAGVDHESGVNACLELAMKLQQLQALTDYKSGTTVSIGRIEGGKDKFNIVCGEARAKVDVRFRTRESEKKAMARIDSILKSPRVRAAKDGARPRIEYSYFVASPPFAGKPRTDKLLAPYLKAVQELEGRKIITEATGGAGDVNLMDNEDALIVDGLGPIGGGYHTVDEFVDVPTLTTRAQALARLLTSLDSTL